jgi:hypothetical protein
VIAVWDHPLTAKPSSQMWLEWRDERIGFIRDGYSRRLTFARQHSRFCANRHRRYRVERLMEEHTTRS